MVAGQAASVSLVKNGAEYFDEDWIHAAAYVTSPPLRNESDITDAIAEAAVNDVFATICSDHRAYSTETKRTAGKSDFSKIPHGMNGAEDRMAVAWDKIVHESKANASKFVALTSSNAAKILNVYPQKGRIEAGSDADLVVWNPNNVRTISSKEQTESKADFNVFDGTTVHGAPEYVMSNGRVVVYEYEVNQGVSHVGAKILEAVSHPPVLYDQTQNLDTIGKTVSVSRQADETDRASTGSAGSEAAKFGGDDFGITTPRMSNEPAIVNKRLGIYQRPLSAHGVRNQQDSTFSLSGGCAGEPGEFGSPKRTVKINAPPGGSSRAFW